MRKHQTPVSHWLRDANLPHSVWTCTPACGADTAAGWVLLTLFLNGRMTPNPCEACLRIATDLMK